MKYIHTIIVRETEFALLYRYGSFIRELAAGKHRFYGTGYEMKILDRRWTDLLLHGQEFLTADKAQLRASAIVKYRISNARTFATAATEPLTSLYTSAQVALRDVIGAVEVQVALDRANELSKSLVERLVEDVAELGIELKSVAIRDLSIGGELKRVFTETLTARQQSLVTLENARAEAAAIRTLANAARVFESHPALLQLKFLQALEKADGGIAQPFALGTASHWLDFLKK